MTIERLTMALCVSLACACSSDTSPGDDEPEANAAEAVEPAPTKPKPNEDPTPSETTAAPGVEVKASELMFRTEQFTVEPGQERYLCFTSMLDEDVVVDRYDHEAQPIVHHVVFVRALKEELAGFSECNVLFRDTWDPLYITGAGRSTLEFPSGVGHKLTKGTQFLAQLHLLNAGEKTVREAVEIKMHRSESSDPEPVGTYVFGTTKLALPPGETSSVQGDCALTEPLQLIAAFPHMHQLGRKLRFEGGPAMDAMKPLYERDPYDFDDQHIEPIDIAFKPGDAARVTCEYQNTTDHTVTFGESTHEEMCFFIAFARGRNRITSCAGDRM